MNLSRLDQKKAQLDAKRPLPEAAAQHLRDYMLVEWTYHSNAIEGNTLTLTETKVVLEGITVGGKLLKEHLEAVNHAEAIEMVEELVTNREPLTEFVIKQLHYLVLKGIRGTEAGSYRSINVFLQGSSHVPPMNSLVPGLMRDLLDWFAQEGAGLHPVERAAVFHHRFVHIHPFIDGNGRTSRLLSNLILMQAGYSPAIIRNEDRLAYYEALREADETGDTAKLVGLYAEAVDRMLDKVLYVVG